MTLAIRAGGRGDVTKSHTLWKIDQGSKVPTPLYSDGLLYWLDQNGKAVCLDAETGKTIYQQKLAMVGVGDKVYASLVLGDGKLYGVTRQGGTVVLAAGKEFKEIARNDPLDKSIFNGTPVISNGQLLIRSNLCLYCVGK
jgi:outer membrane protein assembly factor BamB